MTEFKPVHTREKIMGKLGYGCDLLDEITTICTARKFTLGRIEAMGAVQKACISYYNQQTRHYQYTDLDFPLEIANLVGNISLKDGSNFVHAHVTLVDETGKTYGGHLGQGTVVFACEFVLEVFDGPLFNRCYDEETGLSLW